MDYNIDQIEAEARREYESGKSVGDIRRDLKARGISDNHVKYIDLTLSKIEFGKASDLGIWHRFLGALAASGLIGVGSLLILLKWDSSHMSALNVVSILKITLGLLIFLEWFARRRRIGR